MSRKRGSAHKMGHKTRRFGRWDCFDCGKTRVLTSNKDCTRCGMPMLPHLQASEKPYADPNGPIVKPGDKRVQWGADRRSIYCNVCGRPNHNTNKKCWSCNDRIDHLDTVMEEIIYVDGFNDDDLTITGPRPASQYDRLEVAERVLSGQPEDRGKWVVQGALPTTNTSEKRWGQPFDKQAVETVQTPIIDRLSTLASTYRPELRVAGISAVVIFFGWLIWFNVFNTTPVEMSVTDMSWERTTIIQEERTVKDEGWSVPFGGREYYSETRKSGTRQVADGQESYYCAGSSDSGGGFSGSGGGGFSGSSSGSGGDYTDYGDGTFGYDAFLFNWDTITNPFERFNPQWAKADTCYRTRYKSEDVYDTYYFYEIERWFTVDTLYASDASALDGLTEPYWPVAENLAHNERSSHNDQTYLVYLVTLDEDQQKYTRDVKLKTLMDATVGQEVLGHVNRGGSLRRVDW